MLRKPLLTLTLTVLFAAAFLFGLARLFSLRYASGDVYPPYSTMRADPVGAKGIFEALDALPDLETRRNFRPLKRLQPGKPITLVYLGTKQNSFWTERELEEFDTMIFNGSRAVFAFFPFDSPPVPAEMKRLIAEEREKKTEREEEENSKDKKERKEDETKTEKSKKERKEKREIESGLMSFDTVAKRFGFQFDYLPAPQDHAFDRHAFLFQPGSGLESDLSWHSALYFKDLSPEWKPLYLSETKPVIVERQYGRGSIVLASDSFFFSNEALRKERHSNLLTRIFGGPPVVIFDEEHLGVSDQPGLAQLALKYRLHGVIAGMVLIAILFVWKSSVRFVPPFAEAAEDKRLVVGRAAAQGFDNLLQRAVEPRKLLEICVREWRRSFGRGDAAVARVEGILAAEEARPPKQRNLVAAYREIVRALARH
jgi:hypothetical protein